MNFKDMIVMAVRNLWKRKLRTFLTVLGVIIGTASIVVMMSIGIGLKEGTRKELEQWGNLQVINVSNYGGEGTSEEVKLDDKAVESFYKIENVEAVTPVMETGLLAVANKRYVANIQLRGINPELAEAFGYKVANGRTLKAGDKNQIVLGTSISNGFRNPKLSWQANERAGSPDIDVMTDKITLTYDYAYGTRDAQGGIKPLKVDVVGVMDGMNQDAYYSIMPLDFVMKLKEDQRKQETAMYGSYGQKKDKNKYSEILVKVNDTNNVAAVQQSIIDMGYQAYSLSDSLDYVNKQTGLIQAVLGAIGAVSLLVAAIGIANTMIMSIYERTREIGIMKVIGASLLDIQLLFLTEAAFIGFLGGLAGLALSYSISSVINMLVTNLAAGGGFDKLSLIPLWLALVSLLFSTIVGIIAGFLPALRAMKLSALSAIKTE